MMAKTMAITLARILPRILAKDLGIAVQQKLILIMPGEFEFSGIHTLYMRPTPVAVLYRRRRHPCLYF